MGSTLAFKLNVQQMLGLAMLSPLQVFKMASLSSIHASLDVLGPAGLYATQHWGERLPFLFAGVLVGWIVTPLALAQIVFLRRGGA
jgi:Cu-processing system permease protein